MRKNNYSTKVPQKRTCGFLILPAILFGGLFACFFIGAILTLPDNTVDRGQCTLARSTPTVPTSVGQLIDIQSKLPNQKLKIITPLNASNVGEVGQAAYGLTSARKLVFNSNNMLSMTDETMYPWADVEIDPQAKTIVYIEPIPSYESIIRGCEIATNRQLFAFSSDSSANQTLFSPDGKLFAVNEGRGIISIYDAQTHDLSTTFSVRDGRPWVSTNQLAFSPDSTLLAFAMDDYQQGDYSIRIWDIKTSKQLASLQGHISEVFGLAFNNDGTLIASTSLDGIVHLWGVS